MRLILPRAFCLGFVLFAFALLRAWALPPIEPQLGEQAPELTGLEWVKGGPVRLADARGTSITVVEFWATWCGPCRITIPHLTELQKRYGSKGVVIVGVSDEPLATIRDFVEQMGSQMDYAVARLVSPEVKMGYMGKFGVRTIPHAFVVDQMGRLVWVGHPLTGLDEVLAQLLAGSYDYAAANRAFVASRSIDLFARQLGAAQTTGGQMKELERLAVEIRDALTSRGEAARRPLTQLVQLIALAPHASPALRALAREIASDLNARYGDLQSQQLLKLVAKNAQTTSAAFQGGRPPFGAPTPRSHGMRQKREGKLVPRNVGVAMPQHTSPAARHQPGPRDQSTTISSSLTPRFSLPTPASRM